MKKHILLLALLFFTAQVQAQCNRTYAQLLIGPNFLQSTGINGNSATYDTGFLVAASVGYDWRCGLSFEAEYAYRRNEIDHIDFFINQSAEGGFYDASSCMVNLLWDFPSWLCLPCNLQPFIGAGIGCDFIKMHSSNSQVRFHQKWTQFSWQLMTGVAYPLCCNTELTLEYLFHQGGCHFNNHSIGFGLVYRL